MSGTSPTGTSADSTSNPSTSNPSTPSTTRAVALAGTLFVYLVAELLPIGLLPEMAADLDATPDEIAGLVGWYAAIAAVCGLPASALARRWPRRRVLVAAAGALAVGQVVVAIAPTLEVVAAARGVSAAAHVVVWGLVPLVAADGVPRQQVGSSVGRVFYGTSAATVVGVPAATWLGQAVGWRAVALVLAGAAALVSLGLARTLPARPTATGAAPAEHLPARWPVSVFAVLAATLLAVLSAYAVYPFLSLFAARVGVDGTVYAWLLAGFGVAGILGIGLSSRRLDRHPRVTPLVVVLAATGLPLLMLLPGPLPTAATIVAWGLPMAALPVVLQGTLVRITGPDGELASGAYVVAYQVGIAGGTWIGGLAGADRPWLAAGLGLATLPALAVAVAASRSR